VNVAEPLLAAVRLNRRVEVVSGHLAKRAKAELKLVIGAGGETGGQNVSAVIA
jgi:hypothetical protein